MIRDPVGARLRRPCLKEQAFLTFVVNREVECRRVGRGCGARNQFHLYVGGAGQAAVDHAEVEAKGFNLWPDDLEEFILSDLKRKRLGAYPVG